MSLPGVKEITKSPVCPSHWGESLDTDSLPSSMYLEFGTQEDTWCGFGFNENQPKMDGAETRLAKGNGSAIGGVWRRLVSLQNL